MRSLLALALMMVVTVVGCAAPSVGSYPNRDDRKAPSRDRSDDDDDTAPADDDDDTTTDTGTTTSSQTSTPAQAGQTLTIASTGGGQGDVTCNGAPCTGTFAPGTSVTLAATPKSGSIFTGWTGGGCTGSGPCELKVGAAAPSAKFETLSGNWVGTYTNIRPNGQCKFTNSGAVTQAIAGTPGSYTAAVSAMNGLEIRNLNGCSLVDTREGTAPAEGASVNGDTVTGTWNVKITGINGTLAFPFTAKLKGNKMTGTWTCTNCTGGFEVTKQ